MSFNNFIILPLYIFWETRYNSAEKIMLQREVAMMKKLTHFLLAALVCAVLLPATALADTCYHESGLAADANKCAKCGKDVVAGVTKNGSTQYFEDFAGALENGGSATIKLLTNVQFTAINQQMPAGTATLDLNGHNINRLTEDGGETLIVPSGSNVTLTGGGIVRVPIEINVGGALTVDNRTASGNEYFDLGKVDVNGGSLTVPAGASPFFSGALNSFGGSVSLSGGTYGKVQAGAAETVGPMLAEGYGFHKSDVWHDKTTTEHSLADVHVEELPIKSITLDISDQNYSPKYGSEITLSPSYITYGADYSANNLRCQWYKVVGGKETAVGGENSSRLVLSNLDVGTYTYRFKATQGNYTKTADITFTVVKADITHTTPTTNDGEVFTGSEMPLLSSGAGNTVGTAYYRLGEDGKWGTDDKLTVNKGGDYTVYWYIAAPGNNYNGVGTAVAPQKLTIHLHQLADAWSCTDESHWKVCTVTGCTKKLSAGSHTSTGSNVVTCTAAARCDTCGQPYGTALGHQWSAWTVTKTATTSAAGEVERTCGHCNLTETSVVPKLPTAEKTYTITGTVSGAGDNVVTVSLWQGSVKRAETTAENGIFTFDGVTSGVYNLRAESDGRIVTTKVEITAANAAVSVALPENKTNSEVNIASSGDFNKTLQIVVGKLEELFGQNNGNYTDSDRQQVESGYSVTFTFTVAAADTDTKIENQLNAGQTVGLTLDMTITKRVEGGTGVEITDTGTLLETVVQLPADMQGKRGYTVYRLHGDRVDELTTTPNSNGEYIEVSADGKSLTIHARLYSQYAIAYTSAGSGTYRHPTATGAAASPATGDMGLALYAALALTSLTGMGWTAKKRK